MQASGPLSRQRKLTGRPRPRLYISCDSEDVRLPVACSRTFEKDNKEFCMKIGTGKDSVFGPDARALVLAISLLLLQANPPARPGKVAHAQAPKIQEPLSGGVPGTQLMDKSVHAPRSEVKHSGPKRPATSCRIADRFQSYHTRTCGRLFAYWQEDNNTLHFLDRHAFIEVMHSLNFILLSFSGETMHEHTRRTQHASRTGSRSRFFNTSLGRPEIPHPSKDCHQQEK